MSHSERDLSKCAKSTMKEADGSDLSLSGSQVSLVSRPPSVMGKASIRALAVSGPRVRRPMSALPTISFTEITRDKRRPYSADSQLLLSPYQQKHHKLSACFSMSADPMSSAHHDPETDGDIEFSSSTLISSKFSDQLGGAWMELEMRGLYLGHSDPTHISSSTDNGSDLLCCSDVSEEHSRSEKSLGERIQAMARDPHHHSRSVVCTKPTSPSETSQEKLQQQSEKIGINEDPKNMSTKELHQRMVESGLIFPSAPYSSADVRRSSDDSKSGGEHNCDQDLEQNMSCFEMNDLHRRNGHGLCNDISKAESASTEFWNQHHEFLETLNKSSTCGIDQISFPKEHDIDSVEGDSSCSNSGLDSQRRSKSNISAPPDYMESAPSNLLKWPKSDFGPVRFQQWVTDSSGSSGLTSNIVHSSSSFYPGVRNPPSQFEDSIGDHDCTVEEIFTDSESSKLCVSSCLKGEKDAPNSVGNEVSLNAICNNSIKDEDRLPREGSNTNQGRTNPGDLVKEETSNGNLKSMFGSSTVFQVNKITAWKGLIPDSLNPDSKNDSQKVDHISQSSRQEDQCVIRNSSRENNINKKGNCTSKHCTPDAKKMNSLMNDIRKPQSQQSSSKRRNDVKGIISNRRFNKSPPNSSKWNFSPPKEETFPAECHTEVASWMTMCSQDLGDKTISEDNQAQKEPPTPASPHNGDQDSPYNEIMTILRVLEEKEDESSLLRILSKRPDMSAPQSTSSLEVNPLPSQLLSHEDNDVVCKSPSTPCPKADDAVSRLSAEVHPMNKHESSGDLSARLCSTDTGVPQPSVQGELRDLLTFLDAVDQSCSSVLQPLRTSSPMTSPMTQTFPEHVEELLLLSRSELAQEIVSLRLSSEDRDATINLLRTALREQKELQARQSAAHNAELENRISQVKVECEAVIKRHQKFIDQLIADKAALSKRCETLVQDAKDCEAKHAKALANVEEKHKVEMQRVRDITAATEKLKRERWVENKTQKIKELTVRGLEPELTRLTSQHEQEMSALRTLHAQELEQMDIRAARRASQQMEALREQLVQEKEDALAREREMLRQRMEKQQLLFEEEGAEQRRRLVAEVRREQDRLATLEARLEAQLEERKRGLERETEQERDRLRRDYADKLNEMHRKQQNEMLQFRESLKAEKEAWIETYQQQQKQALIQTTNEIRDQLKRERDREIEVVIERLETEATVSREDREKVADNRLRRVREQLTSELKDVESALNTLKEKHTDLRTQMQEKDDKLVSLEAANRSLQTQLVETRKIADQLSGERADLKHTLQAELHSEMECLRQQLSEQHARHQQQLQILSEQSERERQTHQQALQQLFDRVKLAITKKEEVVKAAKAKQKAAEEQNSHLQALLDHRRKESLM